MNYFSGQHCSQIKQQLDEELQLTKLLVDRAVDAIFCVDSSAKFIYVNEFACCMVGYSREELLLMTMYDVDPNFSSNAWLSYWQNLKQQGSLYFESLHWNKEGESFPVEITVTYVEYNRQEYGCIFVRNITKRNQLEIDLKKANEALEARVAARTAELEKVNQQLYSEIAERKRAELELEKTIALLNTTLESTDSGIITLNLQGENVNFNQKFVDMWQIPDAIMKSPNPNQSLVFCKQQLKETESCDSRFDKLYSQPKVEGYDILELKDGRFFECHYAPQWLGEQIIGSVWSFRDITGRKLTEKALQRSEARFRTLAETTDAIIVMTQGIQFCYTNPATEAIFGYKQEELLAHSNFHQLLNVRERSQLRERSGLPFPQYQEIKILTKSGEERWLDCSVRVLETEDEQTALITGIDVTQRKQAEEEILRSLEQEKELSEQRNHFFSMVFHELRTPLNIISFSTSLLERNNSQWTEKKKIEYFHHIQTAVQDMNQLLEEVLFINRVEAGKQLFEPKIINLKRFCHDLLAQLKLIDSHQHSINFINEDDYSIACLDEKLLQSILVNLLLNSIKYSPIDSTIELKIFCHNQDIIFQIKDEGIGIPIVDQLRLFEPFHRGQNVGDIPGTGLGLSVVKKIVDLHGGQITVASEVGKGTTFRVALPLNQSMIVGG